MNALICALMGMFKYYPDKTRALFMMKSCKFCKGKGKVNRKEFDKIKKEL